MLSRYNRTVELLTSSGKFRINLGLERISAVLELLGNPQDSLKCIHVAGTNGKGSVCAMLAAVLAEAGMKTGLYTSPHIYDYTERIQIRDNKRLGVRGAFSAGSNISKTDFARLVFEICELAGKNNIDLTEFEILTAVMFKYFAQEQVDIVVLETGLGGRFDATNVIKSNLCAIITHIDYDHTERLGSTIEEITREKEGIIKPDCPVIDAKMQRCKDAKIRVANGYSPPLFGEHQEENLSLVLAALEKVFPEISPEIIAAGLKKVRHPARFQVVDENLIVDACHNPNGAKALRESLDLYFPERPRRFVFGCLKNKDYKNMMQILFRPEDEVCFYQFKNKNACSIDELETAAGAKSSPFSILPPPSGTLTIVCGSIYMISEIVPKEILFA